MAADPTYPAGFHVRQGGNAVVPTGKSLDVESGGSLLLAGVAIARTAAELNAGGAVAPVARTATTDGLTTGLIADAGFLQFIQVTAGGDANSIITLPTPTPGVIVILNVGATGFELRSSAPNTVGINGGTGSAGESAIAANSTCIMICVSATSWKGFFLDADSDLAKVEAAAN